MDPRRLLAANVHITGVIIGPGEMIVPQNVVGTKCEDHLYPFPPQYHLFVVGKYKKNGVKGFREILLRYLVNFLSHPAMVSLRGDNDEICK